MLNIQLHKKYGDAYEMYLRFFEVFMDLNKIHLPKSELQLLSFVAIHDNISNAKTKRDYINYYKSTNHTLNNNISDLMKKGFLVRDEDKKVRLNKSFRFPKDENGNAHQTINLQIKLEDESNREEVSGTIQLNEGGDKDHS